jgi:hypothetical protein
MRLLTYVFAAALLWAVAASGPASSTPAAPAAEAAQKSAAPTPQRALSTAYPR